jgi:hypothetical protein
MEHSVELPRQACVKVMAGSLRFRPVDDANGALQPRLIEAWHLPAAKGQHEPFGQGGVEEGLG